MKISLAPSRRTPKIVFVTIVTLITLITIWLVITKPNATVPAEELSFNQVEQGKMSHYANAYGELISAQERLVTAPAQGKVAEILVRPGAQVSPDTVILVLTNPQLAQQVEQEKSKLAHLKARFKAFQYEQESAKLDYLGRIAEIEANIESAQLEVEVNESLLAAGTAPKVDLLRAKLLLKQRERRLAFEKQKFQQYVDMQGYQKQQQEIEVQQQQARLKMFAQQYQDLSVTAGISGALQSLEVKLGQSIQLGTSLAKVGSTSNLIARLRLPQSIADKVQLNAVTTVRTPKGEISGLVSRIESVVNQGTVTAEILLTSPLTADARPKTNVSGQVFVEELANALFVPQSPGLKPNSRQAVFVKNNNQLIQRNVVFSELSKGHLLIKSGLAAGDLLVSSDTTDFNEFSRIEIQ